MLLTQMINKTKIYKQITILESFNMNFIWFIKLSFSSHFCTYNWPAPLLLPSIWRFHSIFIFNSWKKLLLFSCSVMSYSLWSHGLQRARLHCISLFPEVCLNSCPLSRWCHPTISSSVILLSSRLQSFPASGSFPMSRLWLFVSRGQNTGASALALVVPMNIQGLFPKMVKNTWPHI